MVKHYDVKYCKKHNRFTIRKKGDRYFKNWVGNFSKIHKHMIVIDNGGKEITHRHATLNETYNIVNTMCPRCFK